MSARAPIPRLLAVSDPDARTPLGLEAWATEAQAAGVDALQLRIPGCSDRELFQLGDRFLRARAAREDTSPLLLVNRRADLALACGADGVHLPASGLPVAAVRRLLGDRALVGRSTHSVDEVAAAEREGADYVVLGPIYDTPSKRAYGEPLGVDVLREACRRSSIPILAIGGVGRDRFAELAAAGAHGVAAIRLFARAPVLPETVARFRSAFGG